LKTLSIDISPWFGEYFDAQDFDPSMQTTLLKMCFGSLRDVSTTFQLQPRNHFSPQPP
jgi:hypothetical protein